MRLLHRWWAQLMGYYWTPCPLCGEEFGGHEKHGVWWTGERSGESICRHCTAPYDARVDVWSSVRYDVNGVGIRDE